MSFRTRLSSGIIRTARTQLNSPLRHPRPLPYTASFHTTPSLLEKILNQAKPIEHSKGGAIQDFDMLQDLPRPPMSIDTVVGDLGFKLSTGDMFDCRDGTVGCLIIDGEVLEWDFGPYVEGLDAGIVSLKKEGLGVLEVVFPRPELLLVGLGGKSRILSEATRNMLMGMGYKIEVTDTINAASNFELLATERPRQVMVLLLPPGI
ncbi:hypothetical protein BZA70DRAFT_282618 [Myxozyma melibiosi]|uniref:NADH dehydrogenase [ubiquinone] 1 alpha subcomplex assembly factor 3 n=1 Tax=Myxozyma melibiosi TaxID=54550 RepID=A0ABR1F0X0_9ASCO